MSVVIETLIYCDGCQENCRGDDRDWTARLIRASRKKHKGWEQIGSQDYCDRCKRTKKIRKETIKNGR